MSYNQSKMPRNVQERGLQFKLGGEFGENPKVDDFCRKVLELLPGLDRHEPLVMLTSLENGNVPGVVSSLTIRSGNRERQTMVLSDLKSLQEYCSENKVRGMIIIVPNLEIGGISFRAEEALRNIFTGIGKVNNPDNYRVWLVDKDAADLLTQPQTGIDEERLADKRRKVQEMGLYGVTYHHCPQERIGWFEARPAKKPKITEKDVSGDEKIRFLKKWMEYIIEYRGGRIISSAELEERLKRSNSVFVAMSRVSDAKGVLSEEACGCLVRTDLNGGVEDILKCDGENCFKERKSRDSKGLFRLGKEYPITKCGDCGGKRTAKAFWVNMGSFDPDLGIKVTYEILCQDFASHGKKDTVWVDPARIINPMYIYNSQPPKKDA